MELFSVDHIDASKILIAARIASLKVTVVEKAPAGHLLDIALGHFGWEYSVPVLTTPEGPLFGTHAILRFLARSAPSSHLYGQSSALAKVDQWLDFVDNQARLAASPLIYNALNIMHLDHKALHIAQGQLTYALAAADSALLNQMFLGGDRFTIADISLSVTLHAIVSRKLFDISKLANILRWYSTCTNQKDFAEVVASKLPVIAVSVAGGKAPKGGKDEKKDAHCESGKGKKDGAKGEHPNKGGEHAHQHKKDAATGAHAAPAKAAGNAVKWAEEGHDEGEFKYAGAAFIAPLIAHYAAAARSANSGWLMLAAGAASAWKDANWPAANLLTVLKRAPSSSDVSLHVSSHTVHGDYEIARYLAHRYRSLNLYAAAPLDSAQVDEFLELTLSAPSKEVLTRLDTHLTLRTYLADHNVTIADFFVWAWLLSEPPAASSYPHLARWFAHFPKHVAIVLYTASTAAPAASAAAGAKKEDDFDLFADEEDAEHEKILEQRRKEHEEKKKSSGKVVIAKSSVILEVKPWDDTTDLEAMLKAVRSIEMEGLVWGAHKFVPVAFGIKMIQIVATIVDDLVSVEDLNERIQGFEDLVQSVDVAAFNKL